jgi:hypothetical protein
MAAECHTTPITTRPYSRRIIRKRQSPETTICRWNKTSLEPVEDGAVVKECLLRFLFSILMSSEGAGGVLGHPDYVAYFRIGF